MESPTSGLAPAPAPAPRCRFRVPRPVEILGGEGRPRFLGYVSDLSETGMFVQCSNPRAVGTRLGLLLRLPGHPDGVRCPEGQVIWVRGYAGPSRPSPGMGIHFVNLENAARVALRAMCDDPASAEARLIEARELPGPRRKPASAPAEVERPSEAPAKREPVGPAPLRAAAEPSEQTRATPAPATKDTASAASPDAPQTAEAEPERVLEEAAAPSPVDEVGEAAGPTEEADGLDPITEITRESVARLLNVNLLSDRAEDASSKDAPAPDDASATAPASPDPEPDPDPAPPASGARKRRRSRRSR